MSHRIDCTVGSIVALDVASAVTHDTVRYTLYEASIRASHGVSMWLPRLEPQPNYMSQRPFKRPYARHAT